MFRYYQQLEDIFTSIVNLSGVINVSMDKLMMSVFPLIFQLICLPEVHTCISIVILIYFSRDSVRDSFDQLSLYLHIDIKCNRKHFNYTGNVNKILPLIIFTLHLRENIHISF